MFTVDVWSDSVVTLARTTPVGAGAFTVNTWDDNESQLNPGDAAWLAGAAFLGCA